MGMEGWRQGAGLLGESKAELVPLGIGRGGGERGEFGRRLLWRAGEGCRGCVQAGVMRDAAERGGLAG